MPNSRPERIGDQIRVEITGMLSRQVRDPGIGFLTVTRVDVTADLQHARVYYTTLGDDKARRESARALERASPFLRRQLAGRLQLRRAPELQFFFDQSVERQDRVERILREIELERASRPEESVSDPLEKDESVSDPLEKAEPDERVAAPVEEDARASAPLEEDESAPAERGAPAPPAVHDAAHDDREDRD